MKKILCVCLCIALLPLSGCYDGHEIEQKAYVVAMGIDKGETAPLAVTYAFADPGKAWSGGEEGGGGGGEESGPTINVTVEAQDIFSALDEAGARIGKEGTLSHMVLALFSEEIATHGLDGVAASFMRDLKSRPKINLAVCAQPCADYLKAIRPQLESNPERYLKQAFSHQTGMPMPGTTLYEFYTKCVLSGEAGMLPIAAKADEEDAPGRTGMDGMAYFNGGRMIGRGENEDAFYYLLLQGGTFRTHVTVQEGERVAVFDVRRTEKPAVRVIKGTPDRVLVTLKVDGAPVSDTAGFSDTQEERRFLTHYLNEGIKAYLEKTAYSVGDLFGFGRAARRNFTTWQEWERYDWGDRYPFARFSVETDVTVQRNGLVE